MSFSGSVNNIYNTSSSNITTINHNNGNNINLSRNDKNIDSDNTSTNSLNNYMNNYYDNDNESNNICTNSINNIQPSGNINLRDNNLSGDTISASYVANNDSDLGFSECNKVVIFLPIIRRLKIFLEKRIVCKTLLIKALINLRKSKFIMLIAFLLDKLTLIL